MTEPPRIGVALARTGRLTPLGDPLAYVAGRLSGRGAEFLPADHGSTVDGARRAVRELARAGVCLVTCLGGTTVLPAVVAACAELGLPCLSTALPWQYWLAHRPAHAEGAFHFCWGLDDIAATFTDLWARVPGEDPVGLLWNDGPQGRALRDPAGGFLPVAVAARPLVDPGGYREGAPDYTRLLSAFRATEVRLVSSAATTADLARFTGAAGELGLRLVTCSRWLAYPFGVDHPALDGVATVVAWSPRHRYTSSLDGTTSERLARDYRRDTGRAWLPPLGLAHALLEAAAHAVTAAGSAGYAAVTHALSRLALHTIAGPLDFRRGPAPGIATLPLAGGQWRHEDGAVRLRIVAADRVAAVEPDGDLRPLLTR
ncbi:branched-chain amino acid transport system substrate-binding protein [Crossiella equi]|uniref:Branched-chain amino acid transport system substrate-binding protein n=1 Tax=Crossiella equi TaxID=130796 RepID=A0ABS5AND1_9PSEU|nr:ABC transporter substrate-binding protein [Crossiella equi]MBP2478068.1 branched-chain amino acid transport system substrate-binding protein [Crossiella equi]